MVARLKGNITSFGAGDCLPLPEMAIPMGKLKFKPRSATLALMGKIVARG